MPLEYRKFCLKYVEKSEGEVSDDDKKRKIELSQE